LCFFYIFDEISLEDAKELCYKENNKSIGSWHTKDWKERKDKIIKDKCEQCGSTNGLTLQHFTHTRNYKEIELLAFRFYYDTFTTENATIIDNLICKDDILEYIRKHPREVKMVCPICSANYYKRRKAPIYVCKRCKYEFDEPISKEIPEYIDDFVLSETEKKEIANLKKTSVKFFSDLYPSIIGSIVRKKYLFEIEKMTMLNYLEGNIEYLSFKNTKTFCRKCAFNYDIKELDLCPKCKVNYKYIGYETCVDCLPEGELKNQIRESQAFYKEMREFHKAAGID